MAFFLSILLFSQVTQAHIGQVSCVETIAFPELQRVFVSDDFSPAGPRLLPAAATGIKLWNNLPFPARKRMLPRISEAVHSLNNTSVALASAVNTLVFWDDRNETQREEALAEMRDFFESSEGRENFAYTLFSELGRWDSLNSDQRVSALSDLVTFLGVPEKNKFLQAAAIYNYLNKFETPLRSLSTFIAKFEREFQSFAGQTTGEKDREFLELRAAEHALAELELKKNKLNRDLSSYKSSWLFRQYYSASIEAAKNGLIEIESQAKEIELKIEALRRSVQELENKIRQLEITHFLFLQLKKDNFKALMSHPVFFVETKSPGDGVATPSQTKAFLTYLLLIDFLTEKKSIADGELKSWEAFYPSFKGEAPSSFPSYFTTPKSFADLKKFVWSIFQDAVQDRAELIKTVDLLKESAGSLGRDNYDKVEKYFKNFFLGFDKDLLTHSQELIRRSVAHREHQVGRLRNEGKTQEKQQTELEIENLKVLQNWINRLLNNQMSFPTHTPTFRSISGDEKDWYLFIDFLLGEGV